MIELRAGRWRCELSPALGSAVAGLWLDDVPVLRSTPAAQLVSARQAGCYPLVPFSNRVGHASIAWQGTEQPIFRHPGDAPSAIHGIGSQRPWEILDQDERSAMLAYEHRADASSPFAFDCSHTLRLRDSGLEMTLAVTNQSAQPAPIGLGWRPTFVTRAGSHLSFRAAGRWELGPDRLPTARGASAGLDADCATLQADDAFDGWDGVATLRDASLQVRIASGLTRLLVVSGAGEAGVVVAPVSHAPNAIHLYAGGASAADLGLRILQPGESFMAQMTIEAERLA